MSPADIRGASLNNEQVREEMQSFLAALDSYADRFALDPKITFEEHLGRLFPSKNEDRRS